MAPPTPSPSEISELILCARYGDPSDLDDMKTFVKTYGQDWLAQAKDERGNTCLHMAAGNGHVEIVTYLLSLLPPTALTAQNLALSTPLHWASLNYHLPILRLLCPLLPPTAFHILNGHGKTAVQEAEEACEAFVVPESEKGEDGGVQSERAKERVKREVVVGYLLGCMGLTEGRNAGERKKVDEMVEGVEKDEDGVDEDMQETSTAPGVANGERTEELLTRGVEGVTLKDATTPSSA